MHGYRYVELAYISKIAKLTLPIDCGDKKITVNAVAPGGIKTDMYHAVCKEYIPNGENLNDEQVDEVGDAVTTLRNKEIANTCSSMPQLGHRVTGLVCRLMLQESPAFSQARMANGSMAR